MVLKNVWVKLEASIAYQLMWDPMCSIRKAEAWAKSVLSILRQRQKQCVNGATLSRKLAFPDRIA